MSCRAFGWITASGLLCSILINPSLAQTPDETREREVTARFLSVLEKSPRRGIALDRVYGDHVERGELDALIKTYQDRVAKDPKDGNAWMLLGLIESQRGRDAAAVAAFRSAEAALPGDALPAYYLGQALVLVGQPTAAAEAFERAITRKASRNDMVEIYQALGKVYQRARRDEQALDVWNRLEKLFPDDPRVQEQIAAALAEESKLEPALARYEKLAGSARDPYRRVRFRTEVADLKVKLGRQDDALRDYEALLTGLDPESWLFREVRRRIEEVFTRNDDLAGLAKYYERWLVKSPEDIDAMSRLGKTLATQGRAAESRAQFDRALKLAPSNRTLRLALIEQLTNERKFAEAAAQYEALAKLEPNNPDVVRDRGKMLLRDNAKPDAERKRAASEVWRKLVEGRPDDPTIAAQVAEFFRQAGMTDEALALYRKAVELAPGSPQFREYLGEYYHFLKRPDDALATWRSIASGADRSASSLARLGEILGNFGYKTEAIDTFFEASRLDPTAYAIRLRLADLLLAARRFDEAEVQLIAAEPLAENEERRDEVLAKRVELDEAAGRLLARLATLQAEVAGPASIDASAWRKLARYAEAARKPTDAVNAAEKAVALDTQSVASRLTLARLYESVGRFADASATFRALASLDRRARTEHLTSVARLEARLGRKDEALQAGRELLAASPGNPENLQFFADLCFQLGDNEQGLETLRKAARANESDPRMLLNLADALAREFRTEEAIELSWKAFEKSADLDAKLGLVAKLADLHLRRNQFDRLIARLERIQGEEARRREGTLFLAQAHASLGDYGTARRTLEGLLDGNARDTALLKQLSKLAEDEGDTSTATRFQQQLYEVAPNGETARRLGELALRSGDINIAEALWSQGAEDRQDLARVLTSLDRLSSVGRFELVLATTNRLLQTDPNNWEVLYREARALINLKRPDEASTRFRRILELNRPDDEVGAIVKSRRKNPLVSANAGRIQLEPAGLGYRMASGYLNVRGIAGLTPGYPASQASAWSPGDYGLVRIAALADQLVRARREGKEAEWLASHRHQNGADARTAWDDFYVALLVSDNRSTYEAAKTLVKAVGHDPATDYVFLDFLRQRSVSSGTVNVRPTDDDGPDQTPPLPADEIDLIRDALKNLIKIRSPMLTYGTIYAPMVELRRAGRLSEIDAEYQAMVDSATDHNWIQLAGYMAGERGDFDAIKKLSAAFYRLPPSSRTIAAGSTYIVTSPQGSQLNPTYYLSGALKSKADAKKYGEILAMLDDELALAASPARIADRVRAMRPQPTNASTNVARNLYPIFSTVPTTTQTLDYPKPSLYLEGGSILLLRNIFLFAKRDEILKDFVAHMKKLAEDAPRESPAERQARLAYSAVLWWADDRDAALQQLTRAVEITPGDVELKLTMAELRIARREPEEALAIVDSIDAVDQDVTRRRELLALRLAVQIRRADRARQAAERLFGLRLDSSTQMQLAAQMNQLGMLDLADAVLARTQRQVGNNVDAQVELMNQYRRQGNIDAALQIALQLLRRSTGQSLRISTADETSQKQAVEVLAGSGKLNEMIERIEAQVKSSPDSLVLLQTLATYYRAAGRLDKLKATNETILKLRPEDDTLRVQLAIQLAQAGDFPGSIEQFRKAFANDPSLLSYNATSIINTFQPANRLGDAAALFEQVGLKNFPSPVVLINVIGVMLRDPKLFDQGVSLMAKTLEAFPNDRSLVLNPVVGVEAFWARPEADEIARKAVIPDPGVSVTAWGGMSETIPVGGYSPDGTTMTLTKRLLDASSRAGTLENLAEAINRAMANRPGWQTGKALLAIIKLRQGKVDEGRQALEKVIAESPTRPPYEALMVLGQEVRDIPQCRSLAISFYERAIKNDRAFTSGSLSFKASAMRHLALLLDREGRKTDALAIARQSEERFRGLAGGNVAGVSQIVDAYRRVCWSNGLGQHFVELGDPADAIRIFDEILGATEDIHLARNYPFRETYPTTDSILLQIRGGIDQALLSLKRKESLDATLDKLLKPRDPKKGVDLLVFVNPREVDRAEVRSLLAVALGLAASQPESLAFAKTRIEEALRAHPDDLEVRVAKALLVAQTGDPGAIAAEAGSLDRWADETPLAKLEPGAYPTSRQIDEATRRLGLWLVARVCWSHDSTAELGDRLALKAYEAARRQADSLGALAIQRERVQRALDKGNQKQAEALASEMLAVILEDRLAQAPPKPTSPPPSSGRPTAPGRAAGRARVPAVTVDRFRQTAEFARLATRQGMADLSFRAIREGLKGGPPVIPVAAINSTPQTPVRVVGGTTEPPLDPALTLVESMLIELDALWRENKAAPDAVYETLRDVVLPASRPTEILLYDPTLTKPGRSASPVDGRDKPGPVATMLARWATLAGKIDDLRQKVNARQESPASAAAGRRLLGALEGPKPEK